MGDSNFVMNSGSFFIIAVFVVLNSLALPFLHQIATRLPHNNTLRSLSINYKTHRANPMSSLSKLNLEMYFDVTLSVFLMTNGFVLHRRELPEFFGTFDDTMSSVLSLVFLGMALVFPFRMRKQLKQFHSKSQFGNKEVRRAYGQMFEGLRLQHYDCVMYNFYFVMRRLASAFVLVFLDAYPFFQCSAMMIFSTLNFIYVASVFPLYNPAENKSELLNELAILLCCHVMTLFLNVAIPPSLNSTLGWVIIGVIASNIFANLCIVGYQTLNGIYTTRKANKRQK